MFKGREAKLNRAILKLLVGEKPESIWDIKKQLSKTRGFRRTHYHNINTRIKALEKDGYIRKAGEAESKAGSNIALYEATAKATFAILLDSLCLDDLINELDEIASLSIVSLIITR